jgi:hypothetical protein
MNRQELRATAGIESITAVSDTTTVVRTSSGHCRPATPLESRLWALLLSLVPS